MRFIAIVPVLVRYAFLPEFGHLVRSQVNQDHLFGLLGLGPLDLVHLVDALTLHQRKLTELRAFCLNGPFGAHQLLLV